VLRRLQARTLRLTTIDSKAPSPFAASLLFSYVANYIYDGDAPLAERRAQALSVDQAQLRELLGDAELRELLDPEALDRIERQLQHLDPSYRIRSADSLHDLLIQIGDLTADEIEARSAMPETRGEIDRLEQARRIVALPIAGERRYVAVEDVARYRDALGTPLPPGLPESLLEPVRDPAGDLVLRFARSHGPFNTRMLAERYALGVAVAESLMKRLTEAGRLIEGEFRPGGTDLEWVDTDVLRRLRSRSLARLRQQVEPVEVDALGRFLVSWHGIGSARRGADALLDAIEQLQGAPLTASVLEREILPLRVADYQPAMLDALMAAGEVVWVGVESLGDRDGRVALYLTDHFSRLAGPKGPALQGQSKGPAGPKGPPLPEGRAADVLEYLREHGASFFAAIHQGTGEGFPQETVDALWDLVWQSLVTNDTLHALRALIRPADARTSRRTRGQSFRSRRLIPPTAEGRWSAVSQTAATKTSATEWTAAVATQLLTRHGIVTRETTASEGIAGGFSGVYQVLKAMEDAGRVRRGYFVAGLGGAQFALPTALDQLRSLREPPEEPRAVIIAATDPANPYGSTIKWPNRAGPREQEPAHAAGGPTRIAGALVVLVDGFLAAYLRRGERELLLFAPEEEPQRSRLIRAAARGLAELAAPRGMFLSEMDGAPSTTHRAAPLFVEAGFTMTALGLQRRPVPGLRAYVTAEPEPNPEPETGT
jgi:ATP-dependent Lhr-like helicase